MLTPSIEKERPPFVQFKMTPYGRNVEASERAGRPIPNIVLMACITPHGSKDVFEQPAEEWIAKILKKAAEGEYNPAHAQMFKAQLEAYKQGVELPREGTPILTWARLTPEQQVRVNAMGYTTVEDLAALPDSAVTVIGLDGRIMRDEARAWIKESKELGSVAAENAQLKRTIEEQAEELQAQRAVIDNLARRLDNLEEPGDGAQPRARGRPRGS